MVRKCTNCGLEIDKSTSEYCIRCGNKLPEKEEEIQKNHNASIEKTHDPIVDNCYSGIKGLFLYACIGGILVFICIIIALFFLPGAGNSGIAPPIQTTIPTPQTYTSPASTPKQEVTSDQFSNVEWIWSQDRWGDWQHTASWSGSESGTNSEYGPVIVNDHGEHGTNTNLNGGSTQSSVWRTFSDPSGVGWNTLEFTGLLTATDTKSGRWMTIDVNDQQVFKGNAAQNPPGNGVKFTIKRSFPQSSSVKVKISSGQTSAYRPLFAMQYYSIKLSRSTSSQPVQSIQIITSQTPNDPNAFRTAVPTPIPTPTGKIPPKYSRGDILTYEPVTAKTTFLWIVLDYTSYDDNYHATHIYRNDDGSWGHWTLLSGDYYFPRQKFEEGMWIYGHIDPDQVPCGPLGKDPDSVMFCQDH